jgi:hypothetical protein
VVEKLENDGTSIYGTGGYFEVKRFDESVFLRRSIFSNFQFYAEMAEKLHYEI